MEGLEDKGGGIVLFLRMEGSLRCALVGAVVEVLHLLYNLQKFK